MVLCGVLDESNGFIVRAKSSEMLPELNIQGFFF